jgi:hypothetical protein
MALAWTNLASFRSALSANASLSQGKIFSTSVGKGEIRADWSGISDNHEDGQMGNMDYPAVGFVAPPTGTFNDSDSSFAGTVLTPANYNATSIIMAYAEGKGHLVLELFKGALNVGTAKAHISKIGKGAVMAAVAPFSTTIGLLHTTDITAGRESTTYENTDKYLSSVFYEATDDVDSAAKAAVQYPFRVEISASGNLSKVELGVTSKLAFDMFDAEFGADIDKWLDALPCGALQHL